MIPNRLEFLIDPDGTADDTWIRVTFADCVDGSGPFVEITGWFEGKQCEPTRIPANRMQMLAQGLYQLAGLTQHVVVQATEPKDG